MKANTLGLPLQCARHGDRDQTLRPHPPFTQQSQLARYSSLVLLSFALWPVWGGFAQTNSDSSFAAAWTAAVADPENAREILDAYGMEWCASQQQFEARMGQGATELGCERFGNADIPSVRDSFIPNNTRPIKTVRLLFNVFARDDGSAPTATAADVAAQVAQLNADFAPSRIQFTYQMRTIRSSQFWDRAIHLTQVADRWTPRLVPRAAAHHHRSRLLESSA